LHGAIPKRVEVKTPSRSATGGVLDEHDNLLGFPCVHVQTDTVLDELVYDMSCVSGTVYATPQQALEASGLEDCQALSAFYLEYVGLAIANAEDAKVSKGEKLDWLDVLRQQATDCGLTKVCKRLTALRSKTSGDAPPPPVTMSDKELEKRIKQNAQARQAREDDIIGRYIDGDDLQSLFYKENWSLEDQRDLLEARQRVHEYDTEDEEDEATVELPPRFVRHQLYRVLLYYGRTTGEMQDLHDDLRRMETDEGCAMEAELREPIVEFTDSQLIEFVNSL
jgi:hypothetical protein